MSYLIKLGGSLLFNENEEINTDEIRDFIELVQNAPNISGIVCGGGLIARKYISAGRKLGVSETQLDLLGINISRLNAQLLISAIGDKAYPSVAKSIEEVKQIYSLKKIVVAGGFKPGQSTTTVAMQVSEALKIKNLLILTDVDGIYNKNPKIFPDAEKFDKIDVNDLENLILKGGVGQSAAGEYRIFDTVSLEIFKRSDIKIRLLNGKNLKNLADTLNSSDNSLNLGTLILKSK